MSRKRLRFAVLMDYAFSFFQEEPRSGIDRYAEEAGADFVYFGCGGLNPASSEDRSKKAFFRFLAPADFDGLIAVTGTLASFGESVLAPLLEKLKPMPMVSIGPSIIGEDHVIADNRGGIASMMGHLIERHGIRDFAYVSGPYSNVESVIRLDAFRGALIDAGIPHDEAREFEGDFLAPSGRAAVREFLDRRGIRPRAIVCANDFMATGARDELKARGLAVPFDVAVTGFDDVALSRCAPNRFTTVRQSFDDIGYLAAKRLHALARGEALEPLGPVPTVLRVRGTCGCLDFMDREDPAGDGHDLELVQSLASEIASASADRGEGTIPLQRKWLGVIQEKANTKRSTSGLEDILRRIGASLPGGPSREEAESVLLQLYCDLMEEDSHSVFSEYWGDRHLNIALQTVLLSFQREITHDLSWESHAPRFREIARQCRARAFHVIRFLDGTDIGRGGEIVFSYDESNSSSRWAPGPGRWMPDSEGSLVANMISSEDERFGYFLVDAAAVGGDLYETLRVRFSAIFHDMKVLRRMKELNSNLLRELSQRQDSERRLKDALGMIEHLSTRDQLTDLSNRQGFLSLAGQQVKFMRRQGINFVVLIAGMEGLAAINERYGYKEGDLAIKAAATALKRSLRESDIVARLAGDEFAVLLGKSGADTIALIQERISAACGAVSQEACRPWELALSFGFADSPPDRDSGFEALIAEAENAMLLRRKRGKEG